MLSSLGADDQPLILKGTEWTASGEGFAGDDDTIPFTFTETISFTSDDILVNLYTDTLGERSDPKYGTYTYSHPVITITFKEEGAEDEVFTGTVKDDKIIFAGITFTKK